jgi:hypothetical protein
VLRICSDPRDFGRDEIAKFAVSAPGKFPILLSFADLLKQVHQPQNSFALG